MRSVFLLSSACAVSYASSVSSSCNDEDANSLLQAHSSVRKHLSSVHHEPVSDTDTCSVGGHVECPDDPNVMCAGDQCCPNGSTCPSASELHHDGCSAPKMLDCTMPETPVPIVHDPELEAAQSQEFECSQHRDTPGTCSWFGCYSWRGETECVNERCVCAPGLCSTRIGGRHGVCVDPDMWCRAEGTCSDAPLAPLAPYSVDTRPTFDCGREYTLGGLGHEDLPDLLTHAHQWCNSDFVPEHLRVPENMRGLYWMKGLGLADVAFCGSLGEWDAETLTARLPVWTTFVVGRQPDETIPMLLRAISGTEGQSYYVSRFVAGRHPLIYSLAFTDSSMTEAQISPSHNLFNAISTFPMVELQTSRDGAQTSERPGDIFDRPSFFFGFQAGESYEAVKVMYDDGTLHMGRIAAMRADLMNDEVTYMRYGAC